MKADINTTIQTEIFHSTHAHYIKSSMESVTRRNIFRFSIQIINIVKAKI